jgi:hypothetical protein
MSTLRDITLAELQEALRERGLSPETRVTVTLADSQNDSVDRKRQKALEAMQKLRGTGNGKLMATLQEERSRERER